MPQHNEASRRKCDAVELMLQTESRYNYMLSCLKPLCDVAQSASKQSRVYRGDRLRHTTATGRCLHKLNGGLCRGLRATSVWAKLMQGTANGLTLCGVALQMITYPASPQGEGLQTGQGDE